MLAFLAPLGGLLVSIVGSVVGRVLVAMGMSYVTYKGADTAIGWLLDQIKTNTNALDPRIASFLAFLWVDKAIAMVFSAYSAALLIKTLGGDGFTKLVTKNVGGGS
jgi:uncharacterized membrane protein